MKHLLLTLILLLCGIAVNAADFKVGEAKYQVLPDGTVELKEYKKATGDVVISETVTIPKSKQTYTVTAIGKGAFKKAPLTSVTLPASVKSLGADAFSECANLNSVKISGNISEIPDKCFYKCASLKSIEMNLLALNSVAESAFEYCKFVKIAPLHVILTGGKNGAVCWGVVSPNDVNREVPIVIYPDVDFELLGAVIHSVSPTGTNHVFAFIDPNAGLQALDVFSLVTDPSNMVWIRNYATSPDARGRILLYSKSLREALNQKIQNPNFSAYFGVDVDDNGSISASGKKLGAISAFEKSFENIDRSRFLEKLQEFTRVAIQDPEKLRFQYRDMDPDEVVKYNKEVSAVIRTLCDSVYLVKPTLTEAEVNNFSGFINNTLMEIGSDYGVPNCVLGLWAKYDLLNKDLDKGLHKANYERILMLIDRYFKHKNPKEAPYLQAMQLAALCGTGRWKEAAAYYPKVHRAVTDNGKYEIEPEITYMKNAINAHGFKAVDPVYRSKSKASLSGSEEGNGSLIEFFTEKAINAGIERYKQKKAEKEFRQLYYESMGLDSKGRPLKSKKR